MAETMIVRVRNAILKARFYDCEPEMYESLEAFIETMDPEHLLDATVEARAAIEAMRGADERLSVPGGLAIEESLFEDGECAFGAAASAWDAMIDAALKEEEGRE